MMTNTAMMGLGCIPSPEEEALKLGMEAKSKEFVEKGAELYTTA